MTNTIDKTDGERIRKTAEAILAIEGYYDGRSVVYFQDPTNIAPIGEVGSIKALARAYLDAAKTVEWTASDYFNAGELGPHTVERLKDVYIDPFAVEETD